ncbi:hypothetical protein NDU88_007919 [Pleurodeles waltl]|uniref:Uncharacterized protein n=1 Tax=Pleurodeles waltl TaxID=8319 RepID=A0AAV7NYS6_PLEWA|nr:hypothetical protein NDU88_007919 [Pleurodeles waltl]
MAPTPPPPCALDPDMSRVHLKGQSSARPGLGHRAGSGLPSQAQFKARRGRQVESHQHQRPVLSRSGSPWTRGALHQDTRHHTSSITVVATSGAGPVRSGRPVSQECAGAQSGCPLHQRPPPPDTACRTQGRRHSKAPGSRAPRQAQGLRSFLLTCEGGAGGPARTPGRRHTVLRGLGNTRPSTSSPAATPRQEGGRPVSPAAVGWLPLKRRAVPRPAAYPLTRSVRLPTLTRRQAQGRGARRPPPTGSARLALGSTGARVTHTGPRTRSPSICPGGRPRITGEV